MTSRSRRGFGSASPCFAQSFLIFSRAAARTDASVFPYLLRSFGTSNRRASPFDTWLEGDTCWAAVEAGASQPEVQVMEVEVEVEVQVEVGAGNSGAPASMATVVRCRLPLRLVLALALALLL